MSQPLPVASEDMAKPWHLSAELFRRFLDHDVTPAEGRAVVRHLVSQCPECLGLVGRIVAEAGYWFGKEVAEGLAENDRVLASFEAAVEFTSREPRRIAFERLRGWAHWSALDPLLPNERLPAILARKDWHHWGLFRALLEAATWYSPRDPQEAVDIAQLALDIADLLDPAAVGGEAAAKDMRATAYSVLADCRRMAGDLEGARTAIAEAWKWSEEGEGDPLDKAEIYYADAAYAAAIGEFETAVTILKKALALYRAAGDLHLQGRTLIPDRWRSILRQRMPTISRSSSRSSGGRGLLQRGGLMHRRLGYILAVLFSTSVVHGAPAARTFPMTPGEVSCTELQLERAQRRMAAVGSGQAVFSLGTTALWKASAGGGAFAGLVRLREPDSWNDFMAGMEHFGEADLAFDLLVTRGASILDPHAPLQPQATLVRRDPGTSLVVDHLVDNDTGPGGCCMSVDTTCTFDLTCPQILNFDLGAVPGDSVRPQSALVINNAAQATPNFTGLPAAFLPAVSGTGPGIAADELDEPCGGTITAFDTHVFEILARTLAMSPCYLLDLNGSNCGLASYNVTLFRGSDPHVYRTNIYVVQYLCDDEGVCYSTSGPVALEFHVNWDGKGRLTTGEVRVLAECRRGETLECSADFNTDFMGIFVLPPIFPGHEEEEPAAFHGAPYLVVTPVRKDQVLKATINWAAILSGSGLNQP